MRMSMDYLARIIAEHLPQRVVYFAAIRLIAYTSTGCYGDTIVPDFPAMKALQRWELCHRVRKEPACPERC